MPGGPGNFELLFTTKLLWEERHDVDVTAQTVSNVRVHKRTGNNNAIVHFALFIRKRKQSVLLLNTIRHGNLIWILPPSHLLPVLIHTICGTVSATCTLERRPVLVVD